MTRDSFVARLVEKGVPKEQAEKQADNKPEHLNWEQFSDKLADKMVVIMSWNQTERGQALLDHNRGIDVFKEGYKPVPKQFSSN